MGPTFNSDWFSPHITIWKQVLGPLQGKPNLHFLEVGSHEGRSACWILTNILTHASSKLTCIDLFEMNDESTECYQRLNLPLPEIGTIEQTFDSNILAINAEKKVMKRKGSSRTVLRTLMPNSFDVAYIDGSHYSSAVLFDAVLIVDLLKPSGLIIFDDYLWNCFPEAPMKNPRAGIDAFLTLFQNEIEIIHREYQVIVRKR